MAQLDCVVFDTNVVLSALVFANGRLNKLRFGWQNKQFQPAVSTATAAELIRMLAYSELKLSTEEQETLLADYLPYCKSVKVEQNLAQDVECRGPLNIPFLQLALAAKANYIVTGDEDLLALEGQFPFFHHNRRAVCGALVGSP